MGVEWQCSEFRIDGDVPDLEADPSGGTMQYETAELWHRDPVKCVEELLASPTFRDVTKYAPEQVYADKGGNEQIFEEMWTARWWWEVQVSRFLLQSVVGHELTMREEAPSQRSHNCSSHPFVR